MDEESTSGAAAGLLRRLAALAYDLLLVVALAAIVTFAMLPLTGGEAILATTQGLVAHAYHAVLLLVVFAYFGLCWTRSGQTLGMRAWRIRLEGADGGRPDWLDALARFASGAVLTWAAVAGLVYLLRPGTSPGFAITGLLLLPAVANFAWVLFDGAGRSLQDHSGRLRVTHTG